MHYHSWISALTLSHLRRSRLWLSTRLRRCGFWQIALAVLLINVLWSVGQPIAVAQLSIPSAAEQSPYVTNSSVERIGLYEVATVNFVNRDLFQIAAPVVSDRSNPGDQIPVENRANQIEFRLQQVVGFDPTKISSTSEFFQFDTTSDDYFTRFDPASFQIVVSELRNQPVLQAVDDKRAPLTLLTVTREDADYHATSTELLAERWASILEPLLREGLQERLPSALRQMTLQAFLIGGGTIGISLIIWLMQQWLRRRERFLRRQIARQTSTIQATELENNDFARRRLVLLTVLADQLTLQQRYRLVSFIRWFIRWLQILVLIGSAFWILLLYPWTRGWAEQFIDVPLFLIGVWFLAGLADRITDTFIDRTLKAWSSNRITIFGFEDLQRKSLRSSTMALASKGMTSFFFYGIAALLTLDKLGISTNSVLAGGAIVGLAISFGAQSLIKDLVNGCLILWEDQYAVGDVIAVDDLSGLVENMNLRITQIRDSEGRLITIPNSSITRVANLTRTWSRVDFTVEVAYEADLQKALHVIREVARQMYDEPEWRDRIVEPPEVLGVDQLSHAGMLIRVWIKTQPLQQWVVGREFRYRVRLALDEFEIAIGRPEQLFWYQDLHTGKLFYGDRIPDDDRNPQPSPSSINTDGLSSNESRV